MFNLINAIIDIREKINQIINKDHNKIGEYCILFHKSGGSIIGIKKLGPTFIIMKLVTRPERI